MDNSEINNHFGDMDLYLMDAILKGQVPDAGRVLDIGCGEGRNGIYFIKQGYAYHGVDRNASKLRLLEYLTKQFEHSKASFQVGEMEKVVLDGEYDLIIASRILHFARNPSELEQVWNKLLSSLVPGGVIYFAMDSAMAEEFVQSRGDGHYEFTDGRVSVALSPDLYDMMLSGCSELEPLRTVIHHSRRIQSFGLLRKG